MQLEEIKISITADTKSAISALSQLTSALKTLDKMGKEGADFTKVNQSISKFATGIANISNKSVEKLGKIADAISKLNGAKINPSVANALQKMSDTATVTAESVSQVGSSLEGSFQASGKEFTGTATKLQSVSQSVKTAEENLDEYTAALRRAWQVENQYSRISWEDYKSQYYDSEEEYQAARAKSVATANAEWGETQAQMRAVEQERQALERDTLALNENAEAEQRDANATKKNASAKKENASSTDKDTSETEKNTQAKKTGSTATHSYSNALTKLAATFKRIVLYRAIRSIIRGFTNALKTGITNLYQYSQALNSADGSRFAQTMDTYASIALKLKNSLAAALVPVINAVLPLVQKLAGWLVEAANAVARFFAVLNGQSTYTVAKDVATTWGDDAADSIGGANDAAEELKRTLLGFDEINALDAPNKGGSGGGGGGGGASLSASDMFEERDTGVLTGTWAKVADWVSTIKKDIGIIWGWVETIWNKLADHGVIDIIIGLIDDIITDLDEIFRELEESGVIDAIAQTVADILDTVRKIWNSDLVQAIVKTTFKNSATILSGHLKLLKDILDVINDISEKKFGNLLLDIAKTVVRAVTLVFESVATAIDTLLNGVGIDSDITGWFDYQASAVEDVVDDYVNGEIDTWSDAMAELDKRKPDYSAYMESGKPVYDEENPYATAAASFGGWELPEGITQAQNYLAELRKEFFKMEEDFGHYMQIGVILNTEHSEEALQGIYAYYSMVKDMIESKWIDMYIYDKYGGMTFEEIEETYGKTKDEIESEAINAYINNKYGVESIEELLKLWGYSDQAIEEIIPSLNVDSAEGEKEIDTLTAKWDQTVLKDKAPSMSLENYNKRLAELQNSWKGTTLTTKDLPVSNKGAKSTMDGTATYWKNENFQNKSLSVTTGNAEDAMRGLRNYWNNMSFNRKGIGVSVNLPSGTHVSWYANGGLVDSGQVFVARENGLAEMVGSFGAQTAVANNDQIVAGIASGVATAVSSQNALLAEQNSLLKSILNKTGNVTISTSSIVDGLNRTNRRAGKTVVAMG